MAKGNDGNAKSMAGFDDDAGFADLRPIPATKHPTLAQPALEDFSNYRDRPQIQLEEPEGSEQVPVEEKDNTSKKSATSEEEDTNAKVDEKVEASAE